MKRKIKNKKTRNSHLSVIAWCIFAMTGGIILVLHILIYQHSGAFWRDECSSILLAHAPSWKEMWGNLIHDSFPGLFSSILRAWILAGPGANDAGIRLLGILISLGVVGAVVWSCRGMQVRMPILAITLAGINATMFYTNTSIRAYGLASALIVACFSLFWRVATKPTRWNMALAFLFGLLSIHANYHNSYLFFGIGIAAAAVAAANRNFRRSLIILAMCATSALTMLIYTPIIAAYRSEIIIAQIQVSTLQAIDALNQALSGGSYFAETIWIILAIVLLILCVLPRIQNTRTKPTSSVLLPTFYCLLTVAISVIASIFFLKENALLPYPWHYVPFVALCAAAAECGIRSERYDKWLSPGKIAAAVIFSAISLPAIWDAAHLRRTNMDVIAAYLEAKAAKEDIILINPYSLRPSFKKYYQGPVSWSIVPSDPDNANAAWHADGVSIKTIMMKPDSIRPTIELVQNTLSRGGRVWIVGPMNLPPLDARLPELIPAPHPQYGWYSGAYMEIWAQHLGRFFQQHAVARHQLPVDVDEKRLWDLEKPPLYVVEGWRQP
jgi:hypothetical protein